MKLFENLKNILRLFGFYDDLGATKIPPCQECGACCSYFKITFYKDINKQLPTDMVIKINKNTNAMKGADIFKGKCCAFNGTIGKNCECTIYNVRPNVCREFPVYLRNGKQNPKCYRAREHFGLPGKI